MAAGASFSLVKDKVWGWIVKKPIAVENPDGDPWAPVPVSKARARVNTWFKVTGIGVAVLFGLLGVRSVFVPPVVEAPDAPEVVRVESGSAVSLAEFTARSWATMNESRITGLSVVTSTPDGAWSGNPSGTVTDSFVVSEVTEKDLTDVTVAVHVVFDEGGDTWVGVLVPVKVTGGVPVVRGIPKLVGLPAPVSIPPEFREKQDLGFGDATRPIVEGFFAAWGRGDTAAVVAPGSTIPGLTPGFASDVSVSEWGAFEGSGDVREGIATVMITAGKGQFTVTYHVMLEKVESSGGKSSWMVSEIK